MTTAYTPSSNGNGKAPAVSPQYPEMVKIPDTRPLLESLGATGTSIMSGIITQEEYNPDWFWRDGVLIVEQMLRNDGQIAAMREIVELPIRSADWNIKPGSEKPRDVEIASFIESALFDEMCYTTASGRKLTQKWDDTLRQILMFIMYGFMVFELNYRIEDGWVKWSRWTPLLPRTIYRWWVGPDTELAGIQQWTWKDYNWHFIDIPADKLLHFARRQEGNNFEGISALRAPYKHWFFKDQFYKIDAIGIERNAVVPPHIHLEDGYSDSDAAIAKKITENIRAHENMSVVTTPRMQFEFPKNQQHYAAATMPSIQHHDVMIARSFLAQFINLGSTETGAYALNQSQMEQFLASLQAYCAYISDVINPEIKRLVDYNFTNVESYPTLECSKIIVQNISDLAEIFSKLMSGNNPAIQPTPELSAWLLEQVGAPVASQSPVENDNPSSEAAPDRPENERSGDHGDEETTNVSPTGGNRGNRDGGASDSGSATDAGGDSGGSMASETGAMVEEARLLRESLDAAFGMDAVERGLTFSNPYPRQKGGLFGFGGMHGQHVSSGAGHHGGEGHPSEHDVTGGAHTGGGSGGTGGGGGGAARGSSSSKSEHEKAAPKARASRARSAMSKAEKTGEEKPARAPRAAKGKAAADAAKIHELTPEERAARGLKPEAARGEPLKAREDFHANPKSFNPYQRGKSAVEAGKDEFGEHQIGNMLSKMPRNELVKAASEYGIPAGGTKDELISRITVHVTEGRYNGRTGATGKTSSGRKSSDEAHAAKVAKLEKQIADHEAKLAALKAQHAALTKAGGSKKASELASAIEAETVRLSELMAELENA